MSHQSSIANRPRNSSTASLPATPLWAINALTLLASIGTGVVWNGISFIAEHDYGFPKQWTLTLYVVMGVTYVIGAFSTGRVLRVIERQLSPRAALAVILTAEAAICVSLWFVRDDWMIWVVGCLISALSSWLWPIVESYLTAGRHGPQMRSAIGWWNLSWTGAVAVSMLLIAPLIKDHGRMAIVLLGALHAVALIPLMRFHRSPGAHDHEISAASVEPEYPLLLRAARMLLPLGYVMNAAMTPLLPYLMNDLGVEKSAQTPATSIWMFVRIAAMAIMWQLGFWHGRWGTLLLGALAMTLGFALIVAALSMPMMVIGLAAFGAGMGIVYYAALYYAMAVGRAAVDAGGTHEALIGVGYAVGPLTGLASLQLLDHGWIHGELQFNRTVVAIVWLLILLSAIGIVGTYLLARRNRAARENR